MISKCDYCGKELPRGNTCRDCFNKYILPDIEPEYKG